MIMSGRFTAEELHAAAKRMGSAVGMVTDAMTCAAPWSVAELKTVAIRTGYNQVTLGEIIENARAHKESTPALSCLDSGRFHCRDGQHCRCLKCHDSGENSKFPDLSPRGSYMIPCTGSNCPSCPPVAGEDDVISARELREALMTRINGSAENIETLANNIMKDAAERREPEYSPRTVVKDAGGTFYERTRSGSWLTFGTSHLFSHDSPLRPLEVIRDQGGGS